MLLDKPKCHCGVFGIFGNSNASVNTYYGLHALQHRGQETCGIVTKSFNGNNKSIFNVHKGVGLVSEVFSDPKILNDVLIGESAIGHNRYSTTGSSEFKNNIQPFVVNYRLGNIAVAHNGNITNAKILREELVYEGAIFQTTSDTEVILHLIARSKLDDQVEQIKEALQKLEGAFSITILTDDKLIAARDKYGFRPLSIAIKDNSFIIASESCAFDINMAEYLREVEPGEIVIIDDDAIKEQRVKSIKLSEDEIDKNHCIFEYIYFSRPDSFVFGNNVDKMRRRLGKILATNHPAVDKDGDELIVISVPDSSNTCALGYQRQLEKDGINSKLEIGLIRSHYIGRTFIQPGQKNREVSVRIKYNIVKGVLEGKTVVIVDDSVVRGTTSKQLVKLIRSAEPKEIHFRISSPPIKHPCYYGMDFPTREELIANKFGGDFNKIEEYLGVDSLEYLTMDELLQSVQEDGKDNFCAACFSGKYPTDVDFTFKKEIYEL